MRVRVRASMAPALAVVLLSGAASAETSGSDEEQVLDLHALIAEVIEASPDLAAFVAEGEAREAAGRAAAAFPDPMVGIGVNDVGTTFSRRESMMSMRELMVRQRLPWPGKRALRREVQELLAEAATRGGEARALVLAEAATAAYADLWQAVEARRLRRSQRRALSELVELAELRFEALAAPLSDPLRAELALSRMAEILAELDEREATARAMLAALLSRPEDRLAGGPVLPEEVPPPEPLDELLQMVDEHPALAELEERRRSLLAEARLAEREVFPDVEIGAGYAQRDAAHDMIGVEVMVPLPLFGRGRRSAEAEGAISEARAMEHRRRARRDQLVREARTAHAALERDARTIALYEEEILPVARDNYAAATAAYEAGQVELLTLLDAQLEVYEQELGLLRARASHLRSSARIRRALGARPGAHSFREAPPGGESVLGAL